MTFQPNHIAVDPVSPPAAYIGGKRQLSRRICECIAAVPHSLYAEPFVGMGGVFFKRSSAPRTEVINDRSGDVVNLFRILQRHYPYFMDMLKFQITSRREFERLKASNPVTLTDLERAARFLYLQRLTFGGKVAGRTFGVQRAGSARFNLTRLAPILDDIHERLTGVVIENLDWLDFIDRYDQPETLFYLDPPYWGSEDYYGKELFSRDQYEVMAGRLARIKGRFLLSINDVPDIRSIFSAFDIEDVSLTYTASGGRGKAVRELIISNG
ncbi:DNA adenine methylase [Phyllobacterium leguminum]|uniref:site-specific DNA-methyltransferase (adenine-specific) n=1 Tax=Phyllobacterium leguminum TaxID=314237 RepID=A0A318T577_9HYPH|nr:DNA adenine methylase [Phyllobacterium leguminum]PYE87391.1 site-specific DNA-adenine methylase [Phyllobacterium leguminum]